MSTLWGLLAAAALLWPDHIRSAFDDVPLDRAPEAHPRRHRVSVLCRQCSVSLRSI
jgi:hypothetical protein